MDTERDSNPQMLSHTYGSAIELSVSVLVVAQKAEGTIPATLVPAPVQFFAFELLPGRPKV